MNLDEESKDIYISDQELNSLFSAWNTQVGRPPNEEEAIKIGNDVIFGLAAGVWTNDIGRALRMSDSLRAGTVWVNTYRAVSFMSPFGGYKRSGRGRESGQESIKEFLQTKSVWIAEQTSVSNPFIIR